MINRIIFFLFFFNTTLAFANNLIGVDPSDVKTVSVGKKSYACVLISGKPVFGKAVSSSLIRPYSTTLKKVRKQLRKASGSKATRLQNRFKRLKGVNRKGKKACRQAQNGDGGGTTPPTDGDRNFTTSGEVTAAGRVLFQIPSSVASANVNRGVEVYQNNCSGCHMEARNLTFPEYRSAISRSPMNFSEIEVPNQELADLAAYLNRFRLSN